MPLACRSEEPLTVFVANPRTVVFTNYNVGQMYEVGLVPNFIDILLSYINLYTNSCDNNCRTDMTACLTVLADAGAKECDDSSTADQNTAAQNTLLLSGPG